MTLAQVYFGTYYGVETGSEVFEVVSALLGFDGCPARSDRTWDDGRVSKASVPLIPKEEELGIILLSQMGWAHARCRKLVR